MMNFGRTFCSPSLQSLLVDFRVPLEKIFRYVDAVCFV